VALVLLAGCAGASPSSRGSTDRSAQLATAVAVMDDGYRLPLRRWGEAREARGVVLALHGFNEYAGTFAPLGTYLAARGFLVYACDQRGFGATAGRGHWAGEDRMMADLRAVAALLHQRHPRLPLYLLGESMGGAVVMAAGTTTDVAGVVLIAPAVWSRDTMPAVQRLALAIAASTVPWLEVTGKGIRRPPTDNRPMLRALAADPQVIKATRIKALWGVTNLMDRARAAAPHLPRPALVLYGEHDRIVPRKAFCATLDDLPASAPDLRLVLYARGWHMLTRDLQGERALADIAAWLANPAAPLPSGEETACGSQRLRGFCAVTGDANAGRPNLVGARAPEPLRSRASPLPAVVEGF
jgi:alpha-beta hydrolase superfamily lysophospholipase